MRIARRRSTPQPYSLIKETPPSPVEDTSSSRSVLEHFDLADDQDFAIEEDGLQQRASLREGRHISRQENRAALGLQPSENPLISQFPGHIIDLEDINNCDLAGSKVATTISRVERSLTNSQSAPARPHSCKGWDIHSRS